MTDSKSEIPVSPEDLKVVARCGDMYLMIPEAETPSNSDDREIYYGWNAVSRKLYPPQRVQIWLKFSHFEECELEPGDIPGLTDSLEKWEEGEHPRAKDGRFGNKAGDHDQKVQGKPKPHSTIDDHPDVVKWRENHYSHAMHRLNLLAESYGVAHDDLHPALKAFGDDFAEPDGRDVRKSYRAYLTAYKAIVAGKVPAKDLLDLTEAIRVADWRYIKNLKLDPKPVDVKVPDPVEVKKPDPASTGSGKEVVEYIQSMAVAEDPEALVIDEKVNHWKDVKEFRTSKMMAAQEERKRVEDFEPGGPERDEKIKALTEEWNKQMKALEDAHKKMYDAQQTRDRIRNKLKAEINHILKVPEHKQMAISVDFGGKKPDNKDRILEETAWVSSIVDKSANKGHEDKPFPVQFKPTRSSRAFATNWEIHIPSKAFRGTVAHETGHILENHLPGLRAFATKFFNERTAGEKTVRLSSVAGRGYGPKEVCKPDKFPSPYCGKVYPTGHTELISMGLQYMHDDPEHFSRKDPEYFAFIYDVIRGNYDKG